MTRPWSRLRSLLPQGGVGRWPGRGGLVTLVAAVVAVAVVSSTAGRAQAVTPTGAGPVAATGSSVAPVGLPPDSPQLPAATRAAAAAVRCQRVIQNQRLVIQGTFHETQYVEEYHGGGAPVISGRKARTWAQGQIILTAVLCKQSAGWRLLAPASVESKMLRLYVDQNGELQYNGAAGRGWAILSRDVNPKSLAVDSFVCDKIPFWSFLSEVAGLPYPGKWWVSGTLWVLSKVASVGNNTVCKKIGSMTGTIKFTAAGGYASVSGASPKKITSSAVVTGKKLVVERWTTVGKG